MNINERVELYSLLERGFGACEISRKLGRDRSNISRELRRNSREDGSYDAIYAQQKSDQRRYNNMSKLSVDKDLRDFVVGRLQAELSPEQISGRMRYDGRKAMISHESIYRFIYSAEGLAKELWRLLPQQRKRRKPLKCKTNRGKIPYAVSIHDRPDIQGKFGHWEGDLVCFRQTDNHNLTTLVEKVSRYAIIIHNKCKLTKHVMGNITKLLPEHEARAVTFDLGREFSRHTMLNDCNVDTYFCDKASPWQKGANENFNGRLRRFLPKKHKSHLVTPKMTEKLMKKMNNIPRKCLGYRTPYEVFTENMQKSGALEA